MPRWRAARLDAAGSFLGRCKSGLRLWRREVDDDDDVEVPAVLIFAGR